MLAGTFDHNDECCPFQVLFQEAIHHFAMTDGDPSHIFQYSACELEKRKNAFLTCYKMVLCINAIIDFIRNLEYSYLGVKVYVWHDHDFKIFSICAFFVYCRIKWLGIISPKLSAWDVKWSKQKEVVARIEQKEQENAGFICNNKIICESRNLIFLAQDLVCLLGEKIGKYTGGRIRSHKLDKYYGKGKLAPYAYCDSDKRKAHCINANLSTDGALRYANDARRPGKQNMVMRNILGRFKFSPFGFASKRNILELWKILAMIMIPIKREKNFITILCCYYSH